MKGSKALGLLDSIYGALVLERIVGHAATALGVEVAAVNVLDPEDPESIVVVALHGADEDIVGRRFPLCAGVSGTAVRAGRAAAVTDYRRFDGRYDHPGLDAIRALAAAPARVDDRLVGTLAVGSRAEGKAFSPEDLELLGTLAELAGAALDRQLRRRELEGTAEAQAEALTAELAAWDRQTAEHSLDVRDVAHRTGASLGLSGADLIELELAALLHDVGKLRVPVEVLRKPGPLDPDEVGTIRDHSVWGAELLADIPGLAAVAAIVRFHHERVDGHGYPDGLPGERIPFASRILTACDAYGAMTMARPYREALSTEEALDELRRGAGAQFDPDVVDALTAK